MVALADRMAGNGTTRQGGCGGGATVRVGLIPGGGWGGKHAVKEEPWMGLQPQQQQDRGGRGAPEGRGLGGVGTIHAIPGWDGNVL